MADIRCSNCGKDNPDFLDTCQFCQAPLKPDPLLNIGEEPTKKKTDELEEILPDWLKEARQQGKDEEPAEDVFPAQGRARVPKEEPPDLLAGLMSQAEPEEEEVPDWLAEISPVDEEKPSLDASSSSGQALTDVPEQPGPASTQPDMAEDGHFEEPLQTGMDLEGEPEGQKDELAGWFSEMSADAGGSGTTEDAALLKDFEAFDTRPQEPAAEAAAEEPEDLSWLRDLEAAAKGTGELPDLPKDDAPEPVSSSASDEDLSWLNSLGGTPAPEPERPVSSEENLDWLSKLGGETSTFEQADEEAEPVQSSSEDDLDWLNKLGGTPVTEEIPTAKPESSNDDLDWLNKLGQPSASMMDETGETRSSDAEEANFSWLDNLGGALDASEGSTQAFADTGELFENKGDRPAGEKPFRTAPLNEFLEGEENSDTTPDWLREAMEKPSMPAPGAVSMDWFNEHDVEKETQGTETAVPEEPVSEQPAIDSSMDVPAGKSTQDLDALLDVEMPDWISGETEGVETTQTESVPAAADDSLSPVELPSWVQAMRPVDSAIDGSVGGDADQTIESEGPLAGFQGIIPAAPIGSSLRPKVFSQKLQVTEEQQAGASLLEQIIAAETTIKPRGQEKSASSQRILRWVFSGIFLTVLSLVIALGLQTMRITPSGDLSSLVSSIPEASPVLVVLDYEPSFAGELEAAAGPMLDQLALSRQSTFTFVAMSPNGPALVDRLMFNTGVGRPDGLGYRAGQGYFNLGFLPGGSSGVLGFIEDPVVQFFRYEAFILMTDNAETGRVWIEQLEAAGPGISSKPLLLVSSAQSGPLLRPYVDSGQADILVNGLYDAARFELMNVSRPGTARAYWDAFGIGLMIAVLAIVLGSVWSVILRVREKRAQPEGG